jgi:hypothetical protein
MPAPSRTFSIARFYRYPTITEDNHTKGKIMSNLATVWAAAAEGYRTDGQTYASRYYSENLQQQDELIPVNNSFGNFVRGMWAWKASDPTHIDLENVTVADIVSADANTRTFARMVEAGFLPIIQVSSDLNTNIG